MLLIRRDSIESTRFVCVNVDSTWRKSICARLAIQSGLKMLSIRHDSIELVSVMSIRHTGSRFARDLHRIDFLQIESNRQEPKTNRLKFVVTF